MKARWEGIEQVVISEVLVLDGDSLGDCRSLEVHESKEIGLRLFRLVRAFKIWE